MTITVLSLHSYPVKSCAGLSHRSINLTHAGLAFDREWVVVDQQGVFMTQRKYPRMALIQPALNGTTLSVNAPGMPTLTVHPASGAPSPPVSVRIWSSDTLGQDEGEAAAQWLSEYIGGACRLLRVHPQADRHASPEHVNAWRHKHHDTDPAFPAQHPFGFADGFPFLVANQGSLDELNRQLQAKGEPTVPMNRFRPNIVLQGLDAYEEDYLAGMGIAGMTFAFVKRCARCPIPNIDQATALSAPEPGLTLAAHRRFPEGVLFGVNAVVAGAAAGSCLSVGDTAELAYDV